MRSWFTPALILIIQVILVACNECNDCGPSQNYPFLKVRFYNIDSLLKVNQKIMVLGDSVDSLNVLIASGAEEYIPARDQLQNELIFFNNVSFNIESGKIRVEEISGPGTDKLLHFRDTLTNDSLMVFNFPLSMDEGKSDFYIRLKDRVDTLSVTYNLETRELGESVLVQAYGVNVTYFTFDSLNITCRSETCLSNATTISVYF